MLQGQRRLRACTTWSRPPRRLVFLDIDGSSTPCPSVVSLFVEGKARPVGRITSVAMHHEAGPIALAVIKRGVDRRERPCAAVDGGDFLPDGPRHRPQVSRWLRRCGFARFGRGGAVPSPVRSS